MRVLKISTIVISLLNTKNVPCLFSKNLPLTFKSKPKTVLLAYRVDSQAVSSKSIQF